ncbi:hypothetical protein I4U23_016366 [Adineta vaga]|nr:hypothetical protein I4U23_016366 [Adineta vaga]
MVFKVVSNDGEEFEIDDNIAQQSSILKLYSDEGFSGSVPLSKVNSVFLRHIIEFCNHHKNDLQPEFDDDDDDDPNRDIYESKRADDISEWDLNFTQQFTAKDGTLFDIIMLNFLFYISMHIE